MEQAAHIGRGGADGHAQVFAETAAGGRQRPDLRERDLVAAGKAVGLHAAQGDDEFVVFQAGGVLAEQGFFGAGFDGGALVFQPEKGKLAALAVDDAQAADDAGDELRLAAFLQAGQVAAHELAHFRPGGVEQVAREVKADGGFFFQQALFHAPGRDGGQGRLFAAGAGAVAQGVEQAALVGVGFAGGGVVPGHVERGNERGAVLLEGVERAGADEGFDGAFVHARAVDAAAKVEEAGKRPVFAARKAFAPAFSGGDDGLDGLLAGALDGAQAVADELVADRLEAVAAPVDVGRLKGQALAQRVFMQRPQLVGVVHFHRHVGAEEFGAVVHFQPGGVIGQQRVGGGVAFVEAVAGELFHEVKDFVGLVFADAFSGRAFAEDEAVAGHFFRFFLAHGAAQQVGAAQAVAAQNLGALHHLLLIDHDAVGFAEHAFEQRVGVDDRLFAVLAADEAGNQVHRPRAVEGVQGNQVFQPRRLGVAQHALHAPAFKLEHGFGAALLEKLVGGLVVQRYVFVGEGLLAGVALHDEFARDFQNGERGQAQKVELDQADGFHVVFVVLAHGRVAAGLLVERAKVGELAGGDEHAARVHADVARQALELLRHFHQGFHLFVLLDALAQQRLGGYGVFLALGLAQAGGRVLQADGLARLVGDEFADAVAKAVAHVQHAPHVTDGGARGHGAEGGDLADGFAPVFAFHVVNHAVAVGLAEVHVKVGHGHALGVQKALEQQLVLQRVQIGDLQRVGHQRASAGAAPRPHGAAVVLGPVDEVAHDEEVARKAHFQNGVQLELQPLQIFGAALFALGLVGKAQAQALLQPVQRSLAEVALDGVARGHRKVRQARLAQRQLQAAAAGNFSRVGQRRRHIGKQRLHFLAGFEVLLRREAPRAALVAQHLPFGNAHARFVRLEVARRRKLNGVRGHHRQPQPGGQAHGGAHVRLVIGAARALQLQIKAVRKHARQLQGQLARARRIALHQRLPHRPGLRA